MQNEAGTTLHFCQETVCQGEKRLPEQAPATGFGHASMSPVRHAGVQCSAFVGQPVLPLDVRVEPVLAATILFDDAKLAKLFVGADFRFKFLNHQFDVNCVVEEAEARDVIGYQVVRVTKIHHGTQDAFPFGLSKLPFSVTEHVDQDLEFGEAIGNEIGQPFGFGIDDQLFRRLLNFLGAVIFFHGRLRPIDDILKMLQVAIAQRKCDIEGHGSHPESVCIDCSRIGRHRPCGFSEKFHVRAALSPGDRPRILVGLRVRCNAPVNNLPRGCTALITQNPMDVVASGPPAFTLQQAVEIARDDYDLNVTAAVLVSERDQNFRLTTENSKRYVLKIANALEDPVVTDFQIQALLHIQAKADAWITTPTVLPTTNGEYSLVLEAEGHSHVVRLVSHLEGMPLGTAQVDTGLARDLGRYLARLGRALSDFSHPGANHSLLWDMKQAASLRQILRHIDDRDIRDLATRTLDDFESKILPVFDSLRWQVIHNDMNPDNVLLDDSTSPRIAGVIDFGDMVRSPLIVDVAVAASYLRTLDGNPLTLIAEFLAGYHGEEPLSRLEIDVLHDLIKVRLMTTVSILSWREWSRGADDEYLQAAASVETTAALFLRKLAEIPGEHAAQTYRQVCASVAQIN